MASNSTRRYVATISLVRGLAEMMLERSPGPRLKALLTLLDADATVVLREIGSVLSRKDVEELHGKILSLVERGLEQAGSYQVYLAGTIGVVGDRLSEIPSHSPKHGYLEILLVRLERVYRYYESRNRERGEIFDRDGFNMVTAFEEVF